MAIDTFIFDLDMTLLDSSALNDARKRQDWTYVYNNMWRIRPFATRPLAPHAVLNQLDAQGFKIGIVTSSPRRYAQEILAQHSINYDELVAYHDTANHKPDPEPITKMLSLLSTVPNSAVYVGDDINDVQAAYHANVFSVGAGWGVENWATFAKSAPDIILHTPEPLLRPLDFDRLKYLGTYRASDTFRIFEDESEILHPGSVLQWNQGIHMYSLARYFSTKDPRHAKDLLSQRILNLKNNDTWSEMFGKGLGTAINKLLGGWRPDCIVPIPPKPGQTRNRFEKPLQHALPFPDGVEVDLQGLICVREVEGYKQLRPSERAAAIRGAYDTEYDWSGFKVLLIDDVYTSGETLIECARILKINNAIEVRGLTLSIDQDSFARKHCSLCGARMKIRNGRHGQFWGCSRWLPENAGCNHTEDI